MTRLASLNLIHLFDFYLMAVFVLGTWRRFGQYRAVGGLIVAAPNRWPKLFELIKQHRTIFLTWSTLRPAVLALLLSLIHATATRLIWPYAHLTPADVFHHWYVAPFLVLPGITMLALDVYSMTRVTPIDRPELEGYLDQAEHWLTSWKAPVVRFVTLGIVNPRQIVTVEVRKALTSVSELLNRSLWWVTMQTGLRVAVGLSLWLTWALLVRPAGTTPPP